MRNNNLDNRYKITKSTFIKIVGCLLLSAMFSICLIGCNAQDINDFTVEFNEDHNRYYIRGISESGKQKEELIIPSTISGVPVVELGSIYAPSYFSSPSLKKLFWSGGQKLNNSRLIDACPELETVVFTSVCASNYSDFFSEAYVQMFKHDKKFVRIILLNEIKEWLLEHGDMYYVPKYIIESPSPNVYFYRNYSVSPNDFSEKYRDEWLRSLYSKVRNNEELSKKINEDLIVYCENNHYETDMIQQLNPNELVNFLFNFLSDHIYNELATETNIINQRNCVWIDYIEVGEKINTMPPLPTRDGYEFTGWYINEECTQKADLQSYVKGDMDISFYAGWKQK